MFPEDLVDVCILELWTTFADLLDGDAGNAHVCLKAYFVSTPPVGMFCWCCYKKWLLTLVQLILSFFCQGYSSGIN